MDPNAFSQGGMWIEAEESDSKWLVVCLHGSQGSFHDFEGIEKIFNNKRLNCLYLNGPIKSFSAYRWYTESPGTRYDAIDYLRNVFNILSKNGYPPEKTFLLGFSQGANLVFEFGARCQKPLAGCIAISGRIEEITSLLNEANPQVIKKGRWLVTHGKNDVNLSIDIMQNQLEILKQAGFHIEFREYDKSHEFEASHELPEIADWIASKID